MRTMSQGPRGAIVALLPVVALLAAACGTTTSTPTPGSGASGSVAYAIGADPTTLDPQITDDGNERAVNDNVYETLVWRNGKTSAVEPLLATEWSLKGDTTWEFKLRPNVKFTNGSPMNADAVVASVKRIIDPALKSPQFSYLNSITDAKKVDDLTVQVITNGPDPALPSRMTWLKIIDPGYVNNPDFVNKPVGTGA